MSFAEYKPGKNFWASKPVSRVLYPDFSRGGDHPSSLNIAIEVKRPTRGLRPSTLNLPRSLETWEQLSPLIWSCSKWGLPSQPVSWLLVSSYLTISPLPAPNSGPLAVCFCGTFRRVSPPGYYPAPCSVELGLSSPIMSERSPGLLAHIYSIVN